MIEIALLS